MRVSSVSKTFGYTHVQSSEKRWLKLRGYQVHDLVRIPSRPHNLHLSYSTVTMVTTRANVQHEEKLKKQTNKQAICFMGKTWVLHAITFFGTLVRQRERHNKQSTGFMSKTWVLHVNDFITLFGTTSLWRPFHKYDMKLPSVLMRRFLKDVITTRQISCLFLNLDIFIKNSIPERFVCFWHI